MSTTDVTTSRPGDEERPPADANRSVAFESVLFSDPRSRIDGAQEPAFFGDLRLDTIVAASISRRDEYELAELYWQPLRSADEVRYRQEVVGDLDRRPVRDAVTAFAQGMRSMRGQLHLAHTLRHELQRQRWYLEAVTVYCDATRDLARGLADAPVSSRGLCRLRDHLTALVSSRRFEHLASEAADVRERIGQLEYTVNIKGAHVQVARYEGQDDLTAQVQDTFARFRQGAVKDYTRRYREQAGLNHVEEQVLDRIARLFPDAFARLRDFCGAHADTFDAPLLRFDREVQFYLGYLEHIAPLEGRGLPFCIPDVTVDGDGCAARDGFDLALAATLAADGGEPVVNDFRLSAPERVLVVTGPNQGGKTTFARMIGQLHHLAALGLPVPAREARLIVPDRIFTHFEREESLQTLRGKFEDELVRVHDILDAATDRSLLVMNESFGSTTLADALAIGSEIVERIIATGSLCVFVTFIDELASLGEQTVSMMSTVAPDDPARRTFRIDRRPADGLAYAAALAAKHRLGYAELRERLTR